MNMPMRVWGQIGYHALAVIVLLGTAGALVAQSSAPPPALQRLTDNLALQLDLTYRHDKATHLKRYDELAAAIAAWNRSLRTDADYALMETWLRTAIRNAMPGAGKPLPAPPEFSVPWPLVAREPAPPQPLPAPQKTVVVEPEASQAPLAAVPPQQDEIPLAATQPQPAPPTGPSAPAGPVQRDFWSDHPAARPLDVSDPFRDDPAPQPRPTGIAAAEPPSVRTAMRLPVIETTEVAINLPELASRIGGYNQALRRVEAAAIAADSPDARELAKLLSELDRLTDQRDFIDLYMVGLSPQEQQSTPKLHTADAALGLIEEKVTARLNSSAANNSGDRDILQALVRKLSELQRGLPETP